MKKQVNIFNIQSQTEIANKITTDEANNTAAVSFKVSIGLTDSSYAVMNALNLASEVQTEAELKVYKVIQDSWKELIGQSVDKRYLIGNVQAELTANWLNILGYLPVNTTSTVDTVNYALFLLNKRISEELAQMNIDINITL